MRVLRAVALVFLLALPAGASAAFGAPAHAGTPAAHVARHEPARRDGLLGQLRGFLVSLWSPEGCELDPWGHTSCLPTAGAIRRQTPAADAGCELDPWGRCLVQR